MDDFPSCALITFSPVCRSLETSAKNGHWDAQGVRKGRHNIVACGADGK